MNVNANTEYWHGVDLAVKEDHDRVYARYRRCNAVTCYRFEVADDLSDVRLSLDSRSAWTGIWLLAELLAQGESWRTIAAVAARMRAAVRQYEEKRK